jgi:hypothetical protein
VPPDALPPWQAPATLPKAPAPLAAVLPDTGAKAEVDAAAAVDEAAGGVLPLDPARPQPAASSAATPTTASVLMVTRTGFLLVDGP